MQFPIFSSKTRSSIALAQANLDAAKLNLASTRNQVSAGVRQKSRKVQEADAAKEVARLELQLAQQKSAYCNLNLARARRIFAMWSARVSTKTRSGWPIWMPISLGNRRNWNSSTAGQLDKVLQ